jgi:hypothetical protein
MKKTAYICVLLACCGFARTLAEESKPPEVKLKSTTQRFKFYDIGMIKENQFPPFRAVPCYSVYLLRDSSSKTEYIIVPRTGICQIQQTLDKSGPSTQPDNE